MKRTALTITLFALTAMLLLHPAISRAQNDSTWLDAGTVKLKKGFTQFISIKGEDLEKMPFTNLAEAINVWLDGAYTNSNTLLYVVDGIAQVDVNVYNIHDIEEVICVQNALVQVNGVSQQQQLVLITTRKKDPGGKGLTFAVLANLVKTDLEHGRPGLHETSNTLLYHQYYAGLNKQEKNVQYGISANYLHEPLPSVTGDTISQTPPEHLNRLRLNGYVDVQADRNNEFIVRMSYVNQHSQGSMTFASPSMGTSSSNDDRSNQFLAIPSISWYANLGRGWNNALQLSYVTTDHEASSNYDIQGTDRLSSSANLHSDHWFVRDHLSQHVRLGNWQITKALNISVEHVQESYSGSEFSDMGGQPSAISSNSLTAGTGLMLTPSLDASFRNVFDIQAGLVYSPTTGYSNIARNTKVFPFASASADLLARQDGENHSSLKLFASLALAPNFQSRDYALDDYGESESLFFNSMGIQQPFAGSFSGTTLPSGTGGIPKTDDFWTPEAGASYSNPGGSFQVNYHFARNEFPIRVVIFFPTYTFENLRTSTQRLGFLWKVAEDKDFHWRSGLNIIYIKGNTNMPDTFNTAKSFFGDFNGSPDSWAGGWTNRCEVKEFSFGFDLLYHFNETNSFYSNNPTSGEPSRTNALVLQSLYLSYHLHLPSARSLEVYLNGRDLWESKWSDLDDRRRFYGFGAKLGI